MTTPSPSVEGFLTQFHNSRPGLSSKAFGSRPLSLRGQVYASTYDLLASAVTNENESALDLACGDGFLLARLGSHVNQDLALFGLDMSAGELALAALRLGKTASLLVGRAQSLPYRASQFDLVLCHMALMLMHDPAAVRSEVRRTLKSGGKFAGVVGASPPPSPTRSRYLQALSRCARDPQWETVQLGEPRLRTREGLVNFLSEEFSDVVVEDLHLPLRLAPEELWSWLSDMYDLYLLRPQDRDAVKDELLGSISSDCSADGRIEFPLSMRYFHATAK